MPDRHTYRTANISHERILFHNATAEKISLKLEHVKTLNKLNTNCQKRCINYSIITDEMICDTKLKTNGSACHRYIEKVLKQ